MPRPEHNDYSRISNLPIDETRFDPRVFHPRSVTATSLSASSSGSGAAG